MGTRSYLWHFILSVALCTVMALEGGDATNATLESLINGSRSTNYNDSTGLAANSSNSSVAEPNAQTALSLLGTTSLSPSTMTTVGGGERTDTTPTVPNGEQSSRGNFAGTALASPALPTKGPGTTTPSMGTESGSASSLSLSSATTSHSSSSSSSSSSPKGSSAVTPSPQQSSSSTTETPLATTSHPSTALLLSPLSSPAGITSSRFSAVTAEKVTPGPTTPRPVASTSSTSPAPGFIEAGLSPTLGSSTETSTAQLTPTPLTQGQAMVQVTATSSPMGNLLPSVTTASAGSSATIPSGEGESSTMNQGSGTTAEANAKTSHSLLGTTSLSPSTMRMVSEEGKMDTTSTMPVWEGSTLGTSVRNGEVSPAFPTARPGTSAPSMGTESGTASSLPLSSAVTSHSSSSSSPEGSSAVTPSPQQSSTSSTPEKLFITTSHPSTALRLSSPSSTAGITSIEDAVTAEPIMNSPAASTSSTNPVASTSGTSSVGSSAVTPSLEQSSTSGTTETPLATTSHPSTALVSSTAGMTGVESEVVTAEVTPSPAPSTASTNPVAAASITSPASDPTDSSRSPTLGSSTETPAPPHTSTPFRQGQPTVEVAITSSPKGSPSPSTTMAPAGSSATAPPAEGKSSTTNQESEMTAQPNAKTSHSLPATSSATPSTMNLSISTSVNPSFTGTCLPVSVEVQNVTGEEIQLSWSSGSNGSLYSISVMDGNQEIDNRTTEETKAVFKHLLPGHVYIISVAVLSCAGNNPTSVTVRTDPASCFKRTEFCAAESTGCSDLHDIVCTNNQALSCSVLLKNQTFNNTLYNSDSQGYKAMSERIKTDVVREMRAELKDDRFDIFVLGFRPGSVVADFLSLLPKDEPVDVNAVQSHLSKVLRSKFGDQTEVTVQPLSVQSPTDNISSWRVAVIVLGVLLGVALVLILLAIVFYIYVRRRSGMEFSTLHTW